jgi:hypothetical protein
MPTRQIKASMQYTRAQIAPNSYNEETRSFDVVFVTETPCPAYNYEIGTYNEILSCRPEHVRMQRASQGLPVFDSHYPRTAMVQLGRGANVVFSNGQGKATITLGARADEALIADIKNGILSGISVGYNVFALQGEKVISGETPTYRAIDWEPGEISFAPVQADPNSGIRTQTNDGHAVTIHNYSSQNKVKMTIAEIRAKASNEQTARLDAIISTTRSHQLTDDKVIEIYESERTLDQIRTEYPEIKPTEPVNLTQIREQATKEGLAKLDAILLTTRAAKLPDSDAITFFKSDKPLADIRQLIIEKFIDGQPKPVDGNHSAGIGKEAIDKKREAAEHAMLNRLAPKIFDLSKVEGARDFRGLSTHEIAKELMAERGVNVRMMGKFDIAKAVYEGTRDMSSSDFPLLLENVLNKSLRADYNFAPEFWDKIAAETSVSDFKAKSLYQVDSVNGMGEIPEGDEIKFTKLAEAKQSIKVKSFGEGLQFTRQMFINDDLSAFSKIPSKFVLDWNTLRGDLVWAMITSNVTMDDEVALFHTSHKNLLTGTDSAFGDTALTASKKKFAAQVGIDGKRKIRVQPRYLIVSPDLEISAMKLLTEIIPGTIGDVNIWAKQFELIVEPRLSGAAWYLAADPAQIDGLYYAYLNGNSGLRSTREERFKTDSIDFMVRGEFGVAAIDYRGWQKNAGA